MGVFSHLQFIYIISTQDIFFECTSSVGNKFFIKKVTCWEEIQKLGAENGALRCVNILLFTPVLCNMNQINQAKNRNMIGRSCNSGWGHAVFPKGWGAFKYYISMFGGVGGRGYDQKCLYCVCNISISGGGPEFGKPAYIILARSLSRSECAIKSSTIIEFLINLFSNLPL